MIEAGLSSSSPNSERGLHVDRLEVAVSTASRPDDRRGPMSCKTGGLDATSARHRLNRRIESATIRDAQAATTIDMFVEEFIPSAAEVL
jgi:hypothetical protein